MDIDIQKDKKYLFFIFIVWSFFLLCRPQDYLPFLGSIRPGLTLTIVILIAYTLSAKNHYKLSDNVQFRLYILFILILFIGVPFSYYRSASLSDVFNYASLNILFFILFYQLTLTLERVRKLVFIYCCGITFYAIYILLFGNFAEGRIAFGSMFDPNDTAFFIISFIAFNFVFISKQNSLTKRIIATINIIVGIIVILKTGSRGGMVSFAILACYLLFIKTTTIRISFILKVFLAILAIASLQFVAFNAERYKSLLYIKDDYNVVGEGGRISIWKTGIEIMLSRPITGVGVNRFSEGVGRDREQRGLGQAKWQTAHNSLIQVGAETGIFGFILFFLMSLKVFTLTRQVTRKSHSDELKRMSEMTNAGFLGHFAGAMFLSQAYSIYWVFYVVLSATLYRMLILEEGGT